MKKIRGFGSLIKKFILICFVFIAIFISIAIGSFNYGKIILPILCSVLASAGLIIVGYVYFSQINIVFHKNELCFFSLFQKVLINGKYTRKNKINYSDISNIQLIHSRKEANKKYYSNVNNGEPTAIHLHLEFVLKDESTKWFMLTLFSDKQRVKIIELINAKTGLSKSYNQLVRDLLAPQVDGKIDLK